ncbi:MAG: hypothetical protein GY773_18985 [Actinomycetia bacterium]|nr:hypothetical protein [Actinomycetes bacterium]
MSVHYGQNGLASPPPIPGETHMIGAEVGRQVGALPLDRIRAWVDSTLN